jgi:hypothetical protein
VVCQQHYADCECVGPGNADELGYDVIEENGKLYGIMKLTISTNISKKRIDGKLVWRWQIKDRKTIIGGGYCATREDAKNDLAIALQYAHAKRPNEKS